MSIDIAKRNIQNENSCHYGIYSKEPCSFVARAISKLHYTMKHPVNTKCILKLRIFIESYNNTIVVLCHNIDYRRLAS